MKKKYFLHRQNAPMDTDHVVYVVWCGESVREQRKLTQLMAWAFKTGATLMSWREDIDFYLQIESERVFPGRGLLDFGFMRTDISVTEALRLATSDIWQAYEKSLTAPKTFFYALRAISPSSVDESSHSLKNLSLLTEKGKNLSQGYRESRYIIRFI